MGRIPLGPVRARPEAVRYSGDKLEQIRNKFEQAKKNVVTMLSKTGEHC